jgi:hypothetical protein
MMHTVYRLHFLRVPNAITGKNVSAKSEKRLFVERTY